MQDNKRVVRSRRLYVSTSIMPSFFDQRKKVAEKFGRMKKVIAYLWSTKRDARSVLIYVVKKDGCLCWHKNE